MSWVENNEWLKPVNDNRIRWTYLRRFLDNYRPYRSRLALIVLLALVGSLTAFLIPPVFRLLQRALTERDVRLLGLVMLAYAGVMLFQIGINYVIRVARSRVSTRLNQDVLLRYYVKLLNVSIEDFIAFKQRSNLFQRVIDAMAVTNDVTNVVISGIQSAVMVVVLMIIIGMLSPPILGIVAVGSLCLFTFVFLNAPQLRVKRQRLLGFQFPMISKMLEVIEGIFTIKALTASVRVTSDIRTLVAARQDAEYDEVVAETRVMQGSQIISAAVLVAAVGSSFVLLIRGRLQYSEAFALYVLLGSLLSPVGELARLYQQLSSLSVNVQNYYQVLDIPDEAAQLPAGETAVASPEVRPDGGSPGAGLVLQERAGLAAGDARQPALAALADVRSPAEGLTTARPAPGAHIVFRDVHFAYRNGRKVLGGVSFEIGRGERISLIGRSGSGKTTLMRLLIGFLHPQQGQVVVDGVDVARLSDKNAFRRQFGIVSQQDFFFATSIRENMLFGLDEPRPDEEIVRALQLVNLWDDVERLGKGLDTSYGADLFSGGQKQRFYIARSLLRNPSVVLLDEPTSALDFENEAQVIKAIETLAGGRTTITIAHRLSTVRSSDRVLVLNERRIVAAGTHDELYATSDYYRALCQYNSFIV